MFLDVFSIDIIKNQWHITNFATAAIPSKTRLNAALEDSQIAHLSLLGDPRSTDSA